MLLIFRLPFVLLELLLRRGVEALGALRHLVGSDHEEGVTTTAGGAATSAPPTAPRPAAAPPEPAARFTHEPTPPTADEAIARREAREAAAPPPPPTPLRPVEPEGHVDREATIVESFGPEEDAHATIEVDEPWDGYADMPAAAIVARLRGADEATKAVVRLYEQQRKNRATVLRATQ